MLFVAQMQHPQAPETLADGICYLPQTGRKADPSRKATCPPRSTEHPHVRAMRGEETHSLKYKLCGRQLKPEWLTGRTASSNTQQPRLERSWINGIFAWLTTLGPVSCPGRASKLQQSILAEQAVLSVLDDPASEESHAL